MNPNKTWIGLGGAALLVVASCGSSSTAPPATSAPAITFAPLGKTVSNDVAAKQLSQVRCAHEVSCNDAGTEKKFKDVNACQNQLGVDIERDLRSEVCPLGIDQLKLSTCLEVARAERCQHLLDSIDRSMACRRSEVCIY